MKTAKKVVSLTLICFMLVSSMFVSVSSLAAEPTNVHNIDFENFDEAVYTSRDAALPALTCFENIGDLFSMATLEIANDDSHGKVFKIVKTPDTATLYAGNGCFYIPALNGNGTKVSKASGKLVLEFDYSLGHGTHWRTGLHITPYPVSGNSVFPSIVLQDNNAGTGISGTSNKISDTNWHHWKIVFDLDAKTYTVNLDDKANVLSGTVAFPENALEANFASYRIGVDMNTSYAAFDNFTTSYIAPPTSEELAALASIKCVDSQTVGKDISITPTFEIGNAVSASLYFGDTLISDSVVSGEAVSYTIPADTTLGSYDINLVVNYTDDRVAVKSKSIEVCGKGVAINKNVIDFEDFKVAEYTNATAANAALAPLSDFNLNLFGRTPVSIKESAEGDGHGKILAFDKITAQLNIKNGNFLIPANVEAGDIVAKSSGKINLEFDYKFIYNWKNGLRIIPVSAGKKEVSTATDYYIVPEGKLFNNDTDETWYHITLTYDLDKKVYSGSVGSHTIGETTFNLPDDDQNIAYFMIDTSFSGATTNYIHFDNFTTSYIPPIEYTAEELAAVAEVKISGSQRTGNAVTLTPEYEATKFESASLYLGDTLLSDSVTSDSGVRYFIPADTAAGDYTLKLKMNYTGIGEVIKEQVFTVYSKDEAYENVNVIDFEQFDEATYTTAVDAKAALTCFDQVNANLFGYADVSIATDEQKGKVYRVTKNKSEGSTMYAGNGSTYFPSLYENGAKAFKRDGKLSLEFDFAFSNGTNWATVLMVSPLSKSGYCKFDAKLIAAGGEIFGTGKYIKDSDWHHAKILFDMDTDTYSAWVDDVRLPDGEMKFESAVEHNTYSYRLCTQIYDMGWYTSIDNIKTAYIPTSVYKNTEFTKASQNYATAGLIDSDAEALRINVNKEYSDSVVSVVKLSVNGVEKTVAPSYASKVITIPLSGLALVPGDKVDVYVSHDAMLSDNSYADEIIDLSFTVGGQDGNMLAIADGKAKAVFETDGYVTYGTVCYIASYEGNKLVGLTPTELDFSPVSAVYETEEVTLPESYDEVKCFVFTPSVKPLIDAIVK
ncbi:MAG: hypothetical protein J6B23_08000 [Clostridia bacterium]|nr:hypothetical protein [Clostridia bacterium]